MIETLTRPSEPRPGAPTPIRATAPQRNPLSFGGQKTLTRLSFETCGARINRCRRRVESRGFFLRIIHQISLVDEGRSLSEANHDGVLVHVPPSFAGELRSVVGESGRKNAEAKLSEALGKKVTLRLEVGEHLVESRSTETHCPTRRCS